MWRRGSEHTVARSSQPACISEALEELYKRDPNSSLGFTSDQLSQNVCRGGLGFRTVFKVTAQMHPQAARGGSETDLEGEAVCSRASEDPPAVPVPVLGLRG